MLYILKLHNAACLWHFNKAKTLYPAIFIAHDSEVRDPGKAPPRGSASPCDLHQSHLLSCTELVAGRGWRFQNGLTLPLLLLLGCSAEAVNRWGVCHYLSFSRLLGVPQSTTTAFQRIMSCVWKENLHILQPWKWHNFSSATSGVRWQEQPRLNRGEVRTAILMENFKVMMQKSFKMRSIVVANFGYIINLGNFSQITHGLN